MFLFFSNRLGCMASIIISMAGTVLIILLIKGCRTAETADVAAPPGVKNSRFP